MNTNKTQSKKRVKYSKTQILKDKIFPKLTKQITTSRILTISCLLIPSFMPEALAIDLDAGGKAFFDPVVAFSKVYTPVALCLGGIAGLANTPGELKTKAIGAGGGYGDCWVTC